MATTSENRTAGARKLLEECGIDGGALSDDEALGRAEEVVGAAARYESGSRRVETWERHLASEFDAHDVSETMATMVGEPYLLHVPVMTGGRGRSGVESFYASHFIPKIPADWQIEPISRTVGGDQVVDELVLSFTHDVEIDFLLPGVPPTGRRVESPTVAIGAFDGDKLRYEHIYWDQAAVLVQVGLLDPQELPVTGVEQAAKVLRDAGPFNALITEPRGA